MNRDPENPPASGKESKEDTDQILDPDAKASRGNGSGSPGKIRIKTDVSRVYHAGENRNQENQRIGNDQAQVVCTDPLFPDG